MFDDIIYWLTWPFGDLAWRLAPNFMFVAPWFALAGFIVTAVACRCVERTPVSLYVWFGCVFLVFVSIVMLVFNVAGAMSFPLVFFAWVLTAIAAIATLAEAAVRKLGRPSMMIATGAFFSSSMCYLFLVGLAAASGA